jgi:ABC-2 type transport system permease protein
VFVVFFVAAAFFFADGLGGAAQQGDGPPVTSSSFLRTLSNVTRLLVPLTGAVVAYASVVGERESGTLKLLLSLPHSRLDVLVGKLLGRSGVLAVPVLAGLLVAVPVFPASGVEFVATDYLLFAGLTVLVGVAFVAVGLGASAATDSSRRAVAATFVPFVVFALLWSQVVNRVTSLLGDGISVAGTQLLAPVEGAGLFEAYFLVRAVNPLAAYQMVASNLGSPQTQLALFSPPSRQQYTQQFGELPVYLTDGFFVVLLALWVVLPVAVGYLAFERADL